MRPTPSSSLPRAAVLALAFIAGMPAAAHAITVFNVHDQSPVDNPCPPGMTNDVWPKFKTALTNALGSDAGVIADIEAQVKSRVPDPKEKPVDIDVRVVTEAQFQQEYYDAIKGFPGETRTEKQIKEEASKKFKADGAYTGVSTEKNAQGVQKIKVWIFCSQNLRIATLNNAVVGNYALYDLIVHELTHAKLYSMMVLGLTDVGDGEGKLPFKDHDLDPGNDDKSAADGGDKEFYDEAGRLKQKLKDGLKLAYNPNDTQGSDLLALAQRYDPLGHPIEIVPLSGNMQISTGPLGDLDFNGLAEVPIQILGLNLVGLGVHVFQNPMASSHGSVEETNPGIPFPASSYLHVAYNAITPEGPVQRTAYLQATVSDWLPYSGVYVNPFPTPPFDLLNLRFVPSDADSDSIADNVDPDLDNDGIPNAEDPAPLNPDRDADGLSDAVDNCPDTYNPDQIDTDHAGVGDACDDDDDNDGWDDPVDNCPLVYNPGQEDANHNGIGDVCESAGVGESGAGGTLVLSVIRPNPLTARGAIDYVLPRRGHVRLAVHDLAGRIVTVLVDGIQAAGPHGATWTGEDAWGRRVAAGVYVVRLSCGGAGVSRKLVFEP